jgi:mannose-6-phosphate isomerase-like protein (cupin superfamily)
MFPSERKLLGSVLLFAAILFGMTEVAGLILAGEAAPDEPQSRVVSFENAPSNTADWGQMRRYFTGNTHATQNVLVAVAVVEPGKAVHKAHRHAEEEYLALVEGTGTWSLGGKQSPARRGDILYAKPWDFHGLANTGDSQLIFLVVRYNGKGVPVPPKPDDKPDEIE